MVYKSTTVYDLWEGVKKHPQGRGPSIFLLLIFSLSFGDFCPYIFGRHRHKHTGKYNSRSRLGLSWEYRTGKLDLWSGELFNPNLLVLLWLSLKSHIWYSRYLPHNSWPIREVFTTVLR